MKTIRDLLSENITRLRKARGLSQEALAGLVDIGTITINRYTKKKRFPEPEMIEKLAVELGVEPYELIMDQSQSENADDKATEITPEYLQIAQKAAEIALEQQSKAAENKVIDIKDKDKKKLIDEIISMLPDIDINHLGTIGDSVKRSFNKTKSTVGTRVVKSDAKKAFKP